LDSLKADLVVTAYYDDETSSVISAYELSGTLVEGTSTIAVNYGGQTATFTVTVTDPYAPVIIDVASMLTAKGYYYDGYADSYATSTHYGTSANQSTTPAYSIPIEAGKTYTVSTVHSESDGTYLPVAFSGSIDGNSNITGSGSIPTRGNLKAKNSSIATPTNVEQIATNAYLLTWTFTATRNAYMSIGCLKAYVNRASVSYTTA
jgi:hypothetical protein